MAASSEYGGFWARSAAYSIDAAIVTVLCVVVAIACSFLGPVGAMVGGIAAFFLQVLYWPVMESSARQATFGKQLLGMQVTNLDGERTSFLRALGRNFAKIISAFILCIGFLMVAFTGRKQGLHDMIAGCVVPRTGPSHFMKALLAALVATAVAIAAGWYYTTEVLMPQMKDEVGGGLEAMMKGGMGEDMKTIPSASSSSAPSSPSIPSPSSVPSPSASPAPQAAAPKPAPAMPDGPVPDFDALVGAPLTGYDKPNTVRAGPAIIELSSFFNTSFWLKVNLPMIKDIDVGPAPELAVTKVLDSAGKNWYDAANTFEKDAFFRRARLSPELKPAPHLEGTRTVNIEKGLSEGSLQKVEGELKISIPADVKVETFQGSDAGKDRTVNGATLGLKSLKERDAVVHYRGVSANLLNIRGVAGGKLVEVESRQLTGDAKTVDTDLQVKFKAPVTIVEVVVASGLAERAFPFVLTRGTTAGAPEPAASAKAAKPGAKASDIEAIKAEAAKPEPPTEKGAASKADAKGSAKSAAKPAAGAEAQPVRPAVRPATPVAPPKLAPAAPARPQCVVKPVMTDADLEICRRDRSPGVSAAPAVMAGSPTANSPVVPQPATPRQADCVIKPVMTTQDMDACRRR